MFTHRDDTNRNPSYAIWATHEAQVREIILGDFVQGAVYQDDFMGTAGNVGTTADYIGPWLMTQATAGTVTRGATSDGTLVLTQVGTTDDQGVQIQLNSFPLVPEAGKTILYECRAKVDIITLESLYLGIGTIDTTAFASGVRSMTNSVGFFSEVTTTTAASLDFQSCKATTAEDKQDAATLVADTYLKLGFVIEGVSKLTAYVDGSPVTTPAIVPATHIPIAAMVPTFVCQTENGTPVLTIDWVRVAYLT